ncbi:MAG: hypothetical protein V3R70_08280 [Syntrophobacteria bacterium]
MAVLPGVLGCRPLRRTVEVRLGTNTLRLPGGMPIFVVSRQKFMKYPGLALGFSLVGSRSCSNYKNSKRLRQVKVKTSCWSGVFNQCTTSIHDSNFFAD